MDHDLIRSQSLTTLQLINFSIPAGEIHIFHLICFVQESGVKLLFKEEREHFFFFYTYAFTRRY